MGLFSKSEACPICGGEVKGLFNKKIGEKKTLCKTCSEQVSMNKELLKTATPDYIKKHLDDRRKNAERYTAAHWDVEYTPLSLRAGVDLNGKLLYLREADLDDYDNPVVFSFDQITGYELYRMKKLVDSADDPGETALASAMSVLGGIAKMAGKGNNNDYLRLCLTTTDPYWPSIELKFMNPDTELFGLGGSAKEMESLCQVFKRIVRKEPVQI